MVRKNRVSRFVAIAGFAAIAVLIGIMVMLQVSNAQNDEFKQKWNGIALDSIALTREYQAEEGKWKAGQYDNATMAGIVDKYMPRYQSLIDRSNALETPERYTEARSLLVKAIQTEKDSNEHFKAYLLTGDKAEYQKTLDLFSLSLNYSAQADAAIKEAG
ncbi:MAG TPA: hypothetical protein VF016_00230 [Nitrososphaera sp.]|jgi:hypothetical protein|nr:hypothetical protein [uncultured Nitrososphaera sp.]